MVSKEADLVTTHELGHNFGAEHDPDGLAECAPNEDQGGKFVMYPIAVSGDHENNKVRVSERLGVGGSGSGHVTAVGARDRSLLGGAGCRSPRARGLGVHLDRVSDGAHQSTGDPTTDFRGFGSGCGDSQGLGGPCLRCGSHRLTLSDTAAASAGRRPAPQTGRGAGEGAGL